MVIRAHLCRDEFGLDDLDLDGSGLDGSGLDDLGLDDSRLGESCLGGSGSLAWYMIGLDGLLLQFVRCIPKQIYHCHGTVSIL